MIDIRETPDGITVPLKAFPSAKVNEVKGIRNGELLVAVTAAPEQGKANKAIITLLAKEWKLRKSQLSIIAGETSQHKKLLMYEITGVEFMVVLSQYQV